MAGLLVAQSVSVRGYTWRFMSNQNQRESTLSNKEYTGGQCSFNPLFSFPETKPQTHAATVCLSFQWEIFVTSTYLWIAVKFLAVQGNFCRVILFSFNLNTFTVFIPLQTKPQLKRSVPGVSSLVSHSRLMIILAILLVGGEERPNAEWRRLRIRARWLACSMEGGERMIE